MKESRFQKELVDEIKQRFPGCTVLKNDATYMQGIPDLLILHGKHWGMLECKKDAKAKHQPNQDYYVQKMNEASFARFIDPSNKEEVLNELQQAFGD
jgi:hypothetical protein